MGKIFFTADLHLGHKGILKFLSERPGASTGDIALHDQWLIDLWRSTIGKNDTIYILGDLMLMNATDARRTIQMLPGHKFAIAGNHDSSLKSIASHFKWVKEIADITLKPTVIPTLHTQIQLAMCHYPMISWNNKPQGAIMLHGHVHGRMDTYNHESPDLRWDVGIDGDLAKQCGGFIPAEALYDAIIAKTGTHDLASYANESYPQATR